MPRLQLGLLWPCLRMYIGICLCAFERTSMECKGLSVSPNIWLCDYELRERTHLIVRVFIATITSCTPKNTHDLQTQEISDIMHAPCSFLALHAVIYKATSSYLIWARPDMKPSIWWLCKYFQCSSHNGHCELCEDKRPHLCHGICKGKDAAK